MTCSLTLTTAVGRLGPMARVSRQSFDHWISSSSSRPIVSKFGRCGLLARFFITSRSALMANRRSQTTSIWYPLPWMSTLASLSKWQCMCVCSFEYSPCRLYLSNTKPYNQRYRHSFLLCTSSIKAFITTRACQKLTFLA